MPFYPSDLPGFATCAPLPMPAHAQHASASTQLDHAFPSRMHAPLMANRYRDLNSLINIVIWRGLQVAVVLSEKVDTTLSKGILRVGGYCSRRAALVSHASPFLHPSFVRAGQGGGLPF